MPEESSDNSGVICPECGAEFSEEPRSVGGEADIQCPKCGAEFDNPVHREERDDPFPDPGAIDQVFDNIRVNPTTPDNEDVEKISNQPDQPENREQNLPRESDRSQAEASGQPENEQIQKRASEQQQAASPPSESESEKASLEETTENEAFEEAEPSLLDESPGPAPEMDPDAVEAAFNSKLDDSFSEEIEPEPQPDPDFDEPTDDEASAPPSESPPEPRAQRPSENPAPETPQEEIDKTDRSESKTFNKTVKRLIFLASVLGLFSLILGTGGYIFVSPFMKTLIPHQKESASPKQAASSSSNLIQTAKKRVRAALQLDPTSPDFLREAANDLVQSEKFSEASSILGTLWNNQKKPSSKLTQAYIQTLSQSGQYNLARDIISRTDSLKDSTKKSLFNETIKAEPVRITKDAPKGFKKAKTVDIEGERLFIALTSTSGKRFIFKPALQEAGRYWQRDIYSSRIAGILGFEHKLPESRYFELPRPRLKPLLPEENDEIFDEIEWSGDSTKFVRGALTSRLEGTVNFPIRELDVWRSWVEDPGSVELDQTLMEFADAVGEDFSSELDAEIEETGDPKLRQLAKDISDILLFDYLSSNYHRFKRRDALYGRNLQYGNKRIFGVANDLAFEDRKSRRVKGRFEWVYRFNRETVKRLRWVQPEALKPLLFADPVGDESVRRDLFFERRQDALDRIDELQDEYGDEIYL